MNRKDGRWWAPALGVGALYCFYAATSIVPPMSINDGCHFALLRAMVEGHTFCIDDYAQYTNYFDVAVVDGHFFADRPPGTALIAVPLYAAGRALLGVFGAADRFDPGFYAVSLSSLAGAVSAGILWQILSYLTVGRGATALSVIAFALGSLNWTYAGVFYSHALVILLTLALLLALLRHLQSARAWHLPVIGCITGLCVITDYQTVLLVPLTVLLLTLRRNRAPATRVADLAAWAAGGLPVLLFFLYYNWSCFKSPFALSYNFHLATLPVTGAGSAYQVPLVDGLWSILTHREWGLLLWLPVLFPAVLGTRSLLRANRLFATFALTFAISLLLLTSKLRFFWGGATHDLRYLSALFPVVFVLYGASLGAFPSGWPGASVRVAGFVAPVFQAVHWGFVWFLGFRLGQSQAAVPGLGRLESFLNSVFPSAARYWPLILINAVILSGATVMLQAIWSRREGTVVKEARS